MMIDGMKGKWRKVLLNEEGNVRFYPLLGKASVAYRGNVSRSQAN